MNTTNTVIGVIALILIVVGGFVFFGGDSGSGDLESGDAGSSGSGSGTASFDQAPAFSLEDFEGNTVNSTDFEGKLLVVNSWATWCPFCVDELPDFGRLQEAFPEEIVVIAIDRSESLERAKSFTDRLGVTDQMTFLLDPDDSFYRSIGGFSMPETIFVDAEGNIRIHKRGPMEFDEMKERVETILNS